MKLYFFILVFWVYCLIIATAQTVTIIDISTRQPIAFSSISSPDGQISAVTNLQGKANLSKINILDYLHFHSVGYQSLVLKFSDIEALNYTVALTEKSYSLGGVVISASKFDEQIEEVPQQIQVLNSRDLKFMNQPTTADVLGQTGNILVQKSQLGGGNPIIRGFEANKVLLVIDGVRMNNAIYRAGHLQNIITLDNAILDKVEVVFGPGSVVYGSDALGGVMHFYTRNPVLAGEGKSKYIKTNAFTRYASAANEKTMHADVNSGFKKIGLLSSFTKSGFSDLRQGKNKNQFTSELGQRKYYVWRINGQDSLSGLQAALENITDRHYRVFASTISAPGRNFSLTITGTF